MIEEHVAYTNSEKGKEISRKTLNSTCLNLRRSCQMITKQCLNLIVQMEERGLSSEQAKMEAFNIKANAGK